MLRHLGLIAVSASIVASVGCADGKPCCNSTQPSETVTVEFGGRVVNADTEDPVANVRVSLDWSSTPSSTSGWVSPTNTATSGGDGTFTLPLNLPIDWRAVGLEFTGPAGYDDTGGRFEPSAAPCRIAPCWAAADRPAIRTYPTLVIRPGESIEVRVDGDIVLCGMVLVDIVPCRRVVVAASSGDPVELEIVPHDSSKPMTLALISNLIEFPEMSVRQLILKVPPDGVAYVISDSWAISTATLTARR